MNDGDLGPPWLTEIFAEAERWQVAAHEAGHAFAAARLAIGFRSVSIVRHDDVFGRLSASGAKFHPKQRLKQDVVTMAGPVAEEALGLDDRSRPVRTEWAVDFSYFRADPDRGKEAGALAAALVCSDLELLQRLADALRDRESLTGTEVRAMVSRLSLENWPDAPTLTDPAKRLAGSVNGYLVRGLEEFGAAG